MIPQLMKKYSIPGSAVAIIDNYQIVSMQGYGLADCMKHYPVNLKSVFQVGSVSKTVTAWGVLKLVEEKKIGLEDPVEKHLTRWHLPDSFFNKEEVTIQRILNHTAGLSLPSYSGYSSMESMPTLLGSLNGSNVANKGLYIIQSPGVSFRYSGGGYTLLQLIIEEVTKKDFHEYMKSEIFEPLGMFNSSFNFPDQNSKNLSKSYSVFMREQPCYYFTEKAAAGLYTTIEDLSAFALNNLQAFYEDSRECHLLSTKIVSMMTEESSIYGLGYSLKKASNDTNLIYHQGANRGWRSGLFLIPKQGSGIIILTNSDYGSYLIEDISNKWLDWQTNNQINSYQKVLKHRQWVSKIVFFVIMGLLVYLTFFIKQLTIGKYIFTIKASDIFIRKKVVFILTYLIFIAGWWFCFYFPIYPGGWVIGTFMPAGFELLSIVISGCLLVLATCTLFFKKIKH